MENINKELPKPDIDGWLHTSYDLHKSIIHKGRVDPITGNSTKSKQGKGTVIKTVVNALNVKTKNKIYKKGKSKSYNAIYNNKIK